MNDTNKRQTTQATAKQSLDYITVLLRELHQMANQNKFGMLAYMLEMAMIEASDLANGTQPLRQKLPARKNVKELVEEDEEYAQLLKG